MKSAISRRFPADSKQRGPSRARWSTSRRCCSWDEPLGALDQRLRKDMQLELKKMQQRLGITFIYVTHDQEEALTMSDTIVVMRDGRIHQIGTPKKIYDEPKNAFVADFIGESNILPGTMLRDRLVRFAGTEFRVRGQRLRDERGRGRGAAPGGHRRDRRGKRYAAGRGAFRAVQGRPTTR